MAELFSGDRLRSIDAAVPHQLFATTGFMSTLMRGLVGLNVLPAGTRNGRRLPERLVLAPQLPAGWAYLRIRNLRWRGVTADVNVTRDESGLSISIAPRVRWKSTGDALTPEARSLPIEIRASLPPGTSLAKGSAGAGWQIEAPAPVPNRGPRLWRFDEVLKPVLFDLPYAPGIEVAPVQDPLQLGDLSSRLRIIDAWLDGTTYTLKVEGRRGRSYQARMLIPYRMTIDGARVLEDLGARPPAVSPIRLVVIDMPPADPAAAGAVLRRTDWATVTVTVHLGERLR
jgi:hypothetical protein